MTMHDPEPPGISTMLGARPNILGQEGRWDMVDQIMVQLLIGLILMAVEHLIWG